MDLDAAIDQARQDRGLEWKDLARRVGVTVHTLINMRYGRTNPRDTHVRALERALHWEPGTYWKIRTGELTALPNRTDTPEQQMRLIGHQETHHGRLTWVEHPGGYRDYTLSRTIHGKEQGVTTKDSTDTPEEVVEELSVLLKIMEHALSTGEQQPG